MKWRILFLLFLVLFGCETKRIAAPKIYQQQNLVILVTLDGVRWQDMFREDARTLLPNIYHHFADNGVVIGKLSEVQVGNPAHVSLPGYYEILSGKVTNCYSNSCLPNQESTVADEIENSAVFGSWDSIAKVVPKVRTVDAGKTFGYRPDTETIDTVEDYLKFHQPHFLWISLGDTDEWAHAGSYTDYWYSLQLADRYLGKLVERYPNATIIVTTDHGRGNDWRDHGTDPESARTWILMTGRGIKKLGFMKFDRVIYSYEIKNLILESFN